MQALGTRGSSEPGYGSRNNLDGHLTSRIDLSCAACGYGVAAGVVPVSCPMCREAVWEPVPWRPFSSSVLRQAL
jgi:hypothetical protein